jgi:hypothetical protein
MFRLFVSNTRRDYESYALIASNSTDRDAVWLLPHLVLKKPTRAILRHRRSLFAGLQYFELTFLHVSLRCHTLLRSERYELLKIASCIIGPNFCGGFLALFFTLHFSAHLHTGLFI